MFDKYQCGKCIDFRNDRNCCNCRPVYPELHDCKEWDDDDFCCNEDSWNDSNWKDNCKDNDRKDDRKDKDFNRCPCCHRNCDCNKRPNQKRCPCRFSLCLSGFLFCNNNQNKFTK